VKSIAVITARSGSKGVPCKNIRPIQGRPCIAYSIEAALMSSLDRVIVSTDDEDIASISRDYGAEVPYLRPKDLSGDTSKHILSVLHLLDWLEKFEFYRPHYVCLLQPTSPLRSHTHIDEALNLAISNDADAVISVTSVDQHPDHMFKIDEHGYMQKYTLASVERRQDLAVLYYPNGSIYINSVSSLKKSKSFYPQGALPYKMPKLYSYQIDTELDIDIVTALMRKACRI